MDQWSLKNKRNQAPLSVISAKFAVEILLRLFFKDHQFALRYKSVPPFFTSILMDFGFCLFHSYSPRLFVTPFAQPVQRFALLATNYFLQFGMNRTIGPIGLIGLIGSIHVFLRRGKLEHCRK